jgi:hypothetical protein
MLLPQLDESETKGLKGNEWVTKDRAYLPVGGSNQ